MKIKQANYADHFFKDNYDIQILTGETVIINCDRFMFSYTPADNVVKDEFKGQYKYFGGLQCEFEEASTSYKLLEERLCGIAQLALSVHCLFDSTPNDH
jgi:hypothetical protein